MLSVLLLEDVEVELVLLLLLLLEEDVELELLLLDRLVCFFLFLASWQAESQTGCSSAVAAAAVPLFGVVDLAVVEVRCAICLFCCCWAAADAVDYPASAVGLCGLDAA